MSLTGAILAGGAATRFGGAAKGLLRLGDVRIIDRVADALRPVVDRLLVVSRDPDAHQWVTDAEAVPDLRADRASLVGIEAALHHAAGDVIVVAWDMPQVTTPLFRLLADGRDRTEYAVVPRHDGVIEACCALYRPPCLAIASGRLDHGDPALHRFVDALPEHLAITAADLVTVGAPAHLFANVNVADDLQRLADPPDDPPRPL